MMNKQELKETLIKIKEVADEILETHKNSTIRFGGINYADLSVVDVNYNLHLDGDETFEVLIEECSLTAYEFQEFMIESLKEKLDFFVNVRTEW